VFPARYELNSYIVCRKRLVSKRLSYKDRDRSEGIINECSEEESVRDGGESSL
jgi:hypothetical protein